MITPFFSGYDHLFYIFFFIYNIDIFRNGNIYHLNLILSKFTFLFNLFLYALCQADICIIYMVKRYVIFIQYQCVLKACIVHTSRASYICIDMKIIVFIS